jgi:sulfate adenylyltransferase
MMREDYSESLMVHFRRVETLRQEALNCYTIDLNSRQLCDLELLLNRGLYPLTGYMDKETYESVLETMRLPDGTVWPMPICLDVSEKIAAELSPGLRIALNDQEGFLLAILTVSDVWKADKVREAQNIYGTEDSSVHPGVMQLYDRTGAFYVGGEIEGVSLPIHYDFQQLRLTPSETVRRFTMNGWRRVLGFHTEE